MERVHYFPRGECCMDECVPIGTLRVSSRRWPGPRGRWGLAMKSEKSRPLWTGDRRPARQAGEPSAVGCCPAGTGRSQVQQRQPQKTGVTVVSCSEWTHPLLPGLWSREFAPRAQSRPLCKTATSASTASSATPAQAVVARFGPHIHSSHTLFDAGITRIFQAIPSATSPSTP